MGRGLLWATAEDLARSKPLVLSLYRQYLRALSSEKLGLGLAAQETKKAHVREIFNMGAEERSSHNIRELIDAAEYTLTLLRKGQVPRESYNKASNSSLVSMCGIALCLSGAHVEGHLGVIADGVIPIEQQEDLQFKGPSIADICEGLKRRGPDSLKTETVYVTAVQSSSELQSDANDKNSVDVYSKVKPVAELMVHEEVNAAPCIKIELVGALLSLRGDRPVSQPLRDTAGNILVYNGEIFGGLQVQPGENDTLLLMAALGTCCACACHATPSDNLCACNTQDTTGVHKTVQETLSTLRGPWALVYWQAKHQVLWFGRDVLGRRSLLLHRPSVSDPRFLVASVAPAKSAISTEIHEDVHGFQHWEELQCGIHSISLKSKNPQGMSNSSFIGLTQLHEWEDPRLVKLVMWDRQYSDPDADISSLMTPQQGKEATAKSVLKVLRRSVKNRTSDIRSRQQEFLRSCSEEDFVGEDDAYTPVAVLFSGGLDSMILAALLDESLQPDYGIDLLNVSFEGSTAPDRMSAIAGLAELKRVSPSRRWRLVKVDADLTAMDSYRSHLQSLICPSNTFMDLNIGTALWLAARGEGYVHDAQEGSDSSSIEREERGRTVYKSSARILLVGAGADEQCGGYGRHRTKYRLGGWAALQAEMRIDMQRIWKRNLGRDDRCMADLGKEARFPFLDEEVVETLLDMPLWDIVDLRLPIGNGDKRILREVAMTLGLPGAATLPKRAIQFGSRIARESNKREFGSNRAANQASAGSALLPSVVR